ncbi:MAG: hypothetical protein AAF927_11120 [Bacteroidota bacterium]
MKYFLTICFLLSCVHSILGQGFKEGTIVLRNGDTLKCSFEIKSGWEDEAYLRYSRPDDNFVYNLEASDIVSFGHNGADKWYVSRKVPIGGIGDGPVYRWVFLNSILEGSISLYFVKSRINDTRYYIETEAGELLELIKNPYFHYEKPYNTVLKEVLKRCPEVLQTAEQVAFREKDLVSLFTQYHQCINASYQVKIASPQGWTRPRIGIRAALSTPFTTLPIGDRNRLGSELGFSVRLGLPKSRQRFSIQIDAVIHNTWGLAQIQDDPFLSPIQIYRISPLVRKDLPLKSGALFFNGGVDLFHFERNIELSPPYFSSFGFLRWTEIPRQLIFGFGYEIPLRAGFSLELESRVRVLHYTVLSTSLNLYW